MARIDRSSQQNGRKFGRIVIFIAQTILNAGFRCWPRNKQVKYAATICGNHCQSLGFVPTCFNHSRLSQPCMDSFTMAQAVWEAMRVRGTAPQDLDSTPK